VLVTLGAGSSIFIVENVGDFVLTGVSLGLQRAGILFINLCLVGNDTVFQFMKTVGVEVATFLERI